MNARPDASQEPHRRWMLLAEDDDDIRSALVSAVSDLGLDVRAVADGMELYRAIERLVELRDDCPPEEVPDLIVTDVRMPGRDGVQVVELLRELDWEVPVIVISAYGDRRLKDRVRGMRRALFLDKPIDLALFEQTVKRWTR